MQAESKQVAVNEIHSRNEILNESLDKMRAELMNQKRLYSQLESEQIDKERETARLRKENKKIFIQNEQLFEEKEHLIQMLEMKNHLLATGDSILLGVGSPTRSQSQFGKQGLSSLDYFQAIQKLSMIVFNRHQEGQTTVDESTKSVLRGIFNENISKVLNQQELKIKQQSGIIQQSYDELQEVYGWVQQLTDLNMQYIELINQISQEFSQVQISEMPQTMLLTNEKLLSMIPQIQESDSSNKSPFSLSPSLRASKIKSHNEGSNRSPFKNIGSYSLLGKIASDRDELFDEYEAKNQLKQEETQQEIERLQGKLEQALDENSELQRQIDNLRRSKKDSGGNTNRNQNDENAKLKAQLEMMKEQLALSNKQMSRDSFGDISGGMAFGNLNSLSRQPKDQSSYADLKLVIQKLDNELQREKSQVEFLRQQLNDQSLMDELEGYMDDDQNLLPLSKSGEAKNNSSQGKLKGMGRRNNHKNKSSDILLAGFTEEHRSASSSPFQPYSHRGSNNATKKNLNKKEVMRVHYENQITQLKSQVEDLKQMIEMQSIVIEDILSQRGQLQKQLKQVKSHSNTNYQSPEQIGTRNRNQLQVVMIQNTDGEQINSRNNSNSGNRRESKIPKISSLQRGVSHK